MRITIMAIGSRGDVQPLVALGQGLQQTGYEVRFVAGDEFEPFVIEYGLSFTPLGLDIRQAMAAARDIFHLMHNITDALLNACEDGDAIVATGLGIRTCTVAKARGIPFFYAMPVPGLRTRAFPYFMFPALPLGGVYNLLTHTLAEKSAVRLYPPFRDLLAPPRPPYLFAFSEHVVPRPADAPDYAHITGYWFLDHPPHWQPSPELIEFLDAGPPPVYVGFGSMTDSDPGEMAKLVLDALKESKQRGVLVTGWGGLSPADASKDVFVAESIPFDWLFPRMAAAVHHGGAGTTAIGLRAGLPTVVVPFGLDQPFWGQRVKALGVGPDPIPRKRITVGRLAQAIHVAATDEKMQARAAALGEKIRAEDGVHNAVQVIDHHLGR